MRVEEAERDRKNSRKIHKMDTKRGKTNTILYANVRGKGQDRSGCVKKTNMMRKKIKNKGKETLKGISWELKRKENEKERRIEGNEGEKKLKSEGGREQNGQDE